MDTTFPFMNKNWVILPKNTALCLHLVEILYIYTQKLGEERSFSVGIHLIHTWGIALPFDFGT